MVLRSSAAELCFSGVAVVLRLFIGLLSSSTLVAASDRSSWYTSGGGSFRDARVDRVWALVPRLDAVLARDFALLSLLAILSFLTQAMVTKAVNIQSGNTNASSRFQPEETEMTEELITNNTACNLGLEECFRKRWQ